MRKIMAFWPKTLPADAPPGRLGAARSGPENTYTIRMPEAESNPHALAGEGVESCAASAPEYG